MTLQPGLLIQESHRSQTLNFNYLLDIYTWIATGNSKHKMYKIDLRVIFPKPILIYLFIKFLFTEGKQSTQ